MWRKGNPTVLLMGMQIGAATVENSMEFSQKTKMKLPLEPVIPLLGIYPKIPKYQFKRTYAPQCSQQCYLQQPSVGNSLSVQQEMNGLKNCCTFTQWNSVQQRERILPFVTTWIELENIMLLTYKRNLLNKIN